ncbi:MAG: DUF1566 domain-containing protein [Breznakibacter sp.]
MRKIIIIFTAVILTVNTFAQSPEKMSYQAVIRNSSNALVINTQIGMEINIRQSSPTGTIVYTETQTPITNANGLASIEIGGGAGFNAIDWSNGPYFIETKTATTAPLTTYTIAGTSQLLSVPYALYAKTAGSSTGTSGRYVGELYGGGVVFRVDHTGQHGLIVSMVDLSLSSKWSNITSMAIDTTNDWDGASNTTAITGQSGHTSSAAQLCADYTNADYGTGTYNDWYLPSIGELNHVWNNYYEVQKALTNDGNASTTPFTGSYYWSSSELNAGNARIFYFFGGDASGVSKGTANHVRAVRAF